MTEYELFAIELAHEAARVSLPYFRGACEEADKGGPGAFDPVTQADREAEEAIRRLIAARTCVQAPCSAPVKRSGSVVAMTASVRRGQDRTASDDSQPPLSRRAPVGPPMKISSR